MPSIFDKMLNINHYLKKYGAKMGQKDSADLRGNGK